MRWYIHITRAAEKQLQRFPKHDYKRIEGVIDSMESDPFRGDITKLKGKRDVWRRRSGKYRIIFELFY